MAERAGAPSTPCCSLARDGRVARAAPRGALRRDAARRALAGAAAACGIAPMIDTSSEAHGRGGAGGARVWVAALAFWTVIGLLESASAFVRMYDGPPSLTWTQVPGSDLPRWLFSAVLHP